MLGCNAQYLSSAAVPPRATQSPWVPIHPTPPCPVFLPHPPPLPCTIMPSLPPLLPPPQYLRAPQSQNSLACLRVPPSHFFSTWSTVPPMHLPFPHPHLYYACYSQSRPQLLTLTATAACLPAHYQPTCVLRLTSPFPALHCPAHCAPSAPNHPTQIPIPTAFRTALIHTPKPTSITPLTDHIRSRNSLSPSLPTSPAASPTPPDPSHVMHPTQGAPPHHCRPVPPPLNPPTPSNVPMPTASPARD